MNIYRRNTSTTGSNKFRQHQILKLTQEKYHNNYLRKPITSILGNPEGSCKLLLKGFKKNPQPRFRVTILVGFKLIPIKE